jgi:hypothetical protein
LFFSLLFFSRQRVSVEDDLLARRSDGGHLLFGEQRSTR